MHIRSYIGFITGILLALSMVFHVHAQSASDLADISVVAVPSNPNPGQTVTLTAVSYGVDLSQATLTWIYAGKTIMNGLGQTKITVTAPASGATAIATVTASGFGLTPVSASILLNPGSVDLLWEAADAYAHPFYKGKSMLPIGGAVRVTAIPAPNAPKQITYNWSRNGSVVQDQSGLNHSNIAFENTIFNKQETVAVDAYGGTYQGSGTITVQPQSPTVITYQKKEGFIDYAHGTIKDIVFSGDGGVFRFEPYFFSIKNGGLYDTVRFSLAIDDQSVAGEPVANELRISRPPTAGMHRIDVVVDTIQYSVQRVTKVFNLLFK